MLSDCQHIGLPANSDLCKKDVIVSRKHDSGGKIELDKDMFQINSSNQFFHYDEKCKHFEMIIENEKNNPTLSV